MRDATTPLASAELAINWNICFIRRSGDPDAYNLSCDFSFDDSFAFETGDRGANAAPCACDPREGGHLLISAVAYG